MTSAIFQLLLIINIFQESITGIGLPLFSYADEVLIILSIHIITYNSLTKRRTLKISAATLACAALLLIISLLNPHNDLASIILQSIIHLKFFFYISALITLTREGNLKEESLSRLFQISFAITLIGLLLNLIFQDSFIEFFGGKIQERAGALRLQGFQLKPNDLAILAICYLYYLTFRWKNPIAAKKLVAYTLFTCIIILLNGSRTAFIGIPILLLAYGYETRRLGRVGIIFISLSIPALLFQDSILYAISETISNFSEIDKIQSSLYIRGIMIYYSFVLAAKYFPIGTGAASFGSVLSKGSPVYDELGIGNLSFFHDMDGVYDSNLATILGEFGVIGVIIFYYLLASLYKTLRRKRKDPVLLSLILLITTTSLTNPVFFYQHNSIIFAITLILVSTTKPSKNEDISSRSKL